MRFSRRTAWDLSENSFAAHLRQQRSSGRRLWDLTTSNPTLCGFSYDPALLDALRDALALKYDPDPRGLLHARESVAEYYAGHGAQISADDLILTTSTSESYSYLFRLLCDPGDEVLVPRPGYPLFDFLADLDDVRLKSYPLFFDHGWWIDFARLERSIGPETRALVVVHPNNPTGHWTATAERERLQHLCARYGLALIVDEVFLDYPANPAGAEASFAVSPHPVSTFVLTGLSKIAGLPQMKVAWIGVLGPEPDRTESVSRLQVIADTFLSMNAPVQMALPSWLSTANHIQRQIRDRVRQNLTALDRLELASAGRIRGLPVEAGWSAIVVLPGFEGEFDCAEHLLRDAQVIAHPGSFYGIGERSRIVVSLICPSDEFREGTERILQMAY